ncbi:MAG TPA: M90 family metallopeptidase [Burkholderiaceae bacterium]|nr:M90 family metallopeptidase [Burkholderiaceae bacterium]
MAIADAEWTSAVAQIPFVARLDEGDMARLKGLCEQFLAAKEMAAAGGLELTAAMQVNIAIQACLPILNLGLAWYRGWTGIVVYPSEFRVPRRLTDDDGVVHEFVETIAGEAWDGGPLLLSWDDAQRVTTAGAAYSVVIHEFTHKIDMLDGDADGCPPLDARLHAGLNRAAWMNTLADAYERFCAEVELIEDELPANVDPESDAADPFYAHLPLDPYAAQDEGEFFAVSSEAFFVDPARLKVVFPAWYAQLAQFFRQDPLAGT